MVLAGACLPGSGPALLADQGDGAPPSIGIDDDAGLTKGDVDLGDPFQLQGLTPSHGPYSGGTRTTLTGRGFTSKLRVFLGNTEVPAANVLASDPTRAAIVTPPGPPGLVDVRIRDDATAQERILEKAFTYDAFVVTPNTGATSGGTHITLTGSGTAWSSVGTTVAIAGTPCTALNVTSPTLLDCITPAGTQGTKDVTVTTSDGNMLQARDAFTYSDSDDGYRGGLSGGALGGTMRVLAFDLATGTPIPGAKVIVGGNLATAKVQDTAASGVTEFSGLTDPKVTVTIAAKCHQPMTYVDVPVDTVTAYLPFVLDLSCASGDPPSTGGGAGLFGGIIEGEMLFTGQGEFQRAGWTAVPAPTAPTERQAAYVFQADTSSTDTFRLPTPSEAITPGSTGSSGYGYSIVVYPGNVTIYIVAGLEDRSLSPPQFIPYAMGIARGISVPSQTRVTGVDMKMDVLFDHQVLMTPTPPAPGPRGPDFFSGTVAMTLGSAGYAILPLGQKMVPLPAPATLPFVGVPSLDHEAAGEQYVLGGVAATGTGLSLPESTVASLRTTNANDPVALGGFLNVPVLVEPANGTWGGTHVSFTTGAGQVDLSVVTISSGDGLTAWTIAAPGTTTSYDLPDLNAIVSPDRLGLVHGAISTTVSLGRIDAFSYGSMRQGQLSRNTWNAHATDFLSGGY